MSNKISPFSYVNAINSSSKDFYKDNKGEGYNSFLVNRSLSYFPDTIFEANDMNLLSNVPSDTQFQYYVNTISPRKRFSKWVKVADNDTVHAICGVYNVNYTRAQQILSLLPPEVIEDIKVVYNNEQQIQHGTS